MKKILPPTYIFLCIVLMAVLHQFLPILKIIPMPYGLIGIIPLALGIYLNLKTDKLFTKHETTVKPFENASSLIHEGPFLYSRHPMYVGMVLLVLGIAVIMGTLSPYIPVIAFFFVLNWFAGVEEKSMQAEFGTEYSDYMKKVRRWV